MADENTSLLQDIKDGINKLAGSSGNSAVAKPAATGSGGLIDAANGVESSFNKITTAAGPVVTGFTNIGQTSGYVTHSLSTIAEKLPGVGGAAGSLIKSLGDAREQNLANAQLGLGGNVLGDLWAKTGAVGLKQEEYRQLLASSGNALTGLGSNANLGSDRLLKFGKDVEYNSNLGRELVRTGQMQQAELMQAAAISQYGSKANLDDIKTREKATQYAGQLANEIYKQSQITGKSTTAIEAELEERLKQPEIMAQMRLMSEEQRQSFVQGQAALTGLGKDAGDLGAVLARGGRLSQENQYQLMAMGPAAGEFQRAMRMTQLAQTEDQKRQAAEALERAKAHISAFQSSQQFANMMSNASPELSRYYKSQYEQNVLRERENAAMREYGGTRLDAQRKSEQAVTERIAGQRRDESGKLVGDERQKLSQSLGDAEIRAAQSTAGVRNEIANLNTEFGKSPKAIQGFNTAMDYAFGKGGTVEQAQERVRSFGKDVVEALGGNVKPSGSVPAVGAPGSVGVPLAPPKKHAMGGDIGDGESGIVGDGGPELIKGPASVTSISETANLLKSAVKDSMPSAGGIDISAISDKINTTFSSIAPKTEVPTVNPDLKLKNDELKRQFDDAIKIINESGQGHVDAEIRTMASGRIRLREYEDGNQENFVSLSQEHSEARIKEIVAQANRIKETQQKADSDHAAQKETQIAKEVNQNKSAADQLTASSDIVGKSVKGMSDDVIEAMIPTGKDPADYYIDMNDTIQSFSADAAKKTKDTLTDVTADIPKPTIAEIAPKSSETKTPEVGFFDNITSKFGDMFKNIKMPEFSHTAAIDEIKKKTASISEVKPETKTEIKPPMHTVVPPVQPKPKEPERTVKKEETPIKAPEPMVSAHKATLDDVARLLEQLNKTMAQVASHSESISEASHKTAKNSARATGNKNLA